MAAKRLVEDAREQVAKALRCQGKEITFVSSGTEANNQAIFGLAKARQKRSNRILTTDSEHPSVEEPLKALEAQGFRVIRISTRGGVLGIISEIFENTPFNGIVEEAKLPVGKEVAAIAKLLGIDPGFAACEGCFVTVVADDAAEDCVKALQTLPKHENAAVIGTVCEGNGSVELQGEWGALRKLIVPSGDQLPRMC